jgi:hypothetical protein
MLWSVRVLACRLLIAIGLIAGCDARGQSLPVWTLEHEGTRDTVDLPGRLALPLREVPFTLRKEVALAEEQRGHTLTLSLDCFHGPLALAANGTAIADIGDHRVGEHRFVIPAALTAGRTLSLVLSATNDFFASIGFGVEPRLAIGAIVEPSAAASFNRAAAIVELGLVAVFALLFGTAFAFDRRRRADAAFAAGVVFASAAPLWQLGLLAELGALGAILLGLGLVLTKLAVLVFLYETFGLGRPPRRLVRLYVALLPAQLAFGLGIMPALVVFTIGGAVDVVFAVHVLRLLLRQARSGPQRAEARLMLVMVGVLALLVPPDIAGLMLGWNLWGGAHMLSLGVIGFVISQAVSLARQQALRQRELEHTAGELQRQVAERSRELSEALARLSTQPSQLAADRVIDGRYRIVKRLGAGGMGVVYEVVRISDKQPFALKTLRGRAEPELMSRFAREAQIAAQMSHANVVPVLDIGIADGALFLVMPLVDGGSLEDLRRKFGDPVWARPLLRQIAAGLAALHERGIVHRDLKPANVLIAAGVARIADFGLASLRAGDFADTIASDFDAHADTAALAPALTRAGDLFGTPGYMAPELAGASGGAKPAADIFAFGVIAHEVLTGNPPFVEPPVLARLNGAAIRRTDGARSEPLVERCLDEDPANRPTASELAKSLA